MRKLNDIPPLIKTFTWRLIRRALATGQRAGRYSQNIDKLCTACGKVENDSHLFFHCDFARAVWFSADPPLQTDVLPQEEDGVQHILSSFISDSTSISLLQLITLWYLWKARNDQRFQRKTWTPCQVHHAVAAYIMTQNAAISTGEHQDCTLTTCADHQQRENDYTHSPTTEQEQQEESFSQCPSANPMACTCSNRAHVSQCPLQDTLLSVALNSVRLLTAHAVEIKVVTCKKKTSIPSRTDEILYKTRLCLDRGSKILRCRIGCHMEMLYGVFGC